MKNNIDLIDKVLIKFLLLDGNESSLLEYDDLIKFKFIIIRGSSASPFYFATLYFLLNVLP